MYASPSNDRSLQHLFAINHLESACMNPINHQQRTEHNSEREREKEPKKKTKNKNQNRVVNDVSANGQSVYGECKSAISIGMSGPKQQNSCIFSFSSTLRVIRVARQRQQARTIHHFTKMKRFGRSKCTVRARCMQRK